MPVAHETASGLCSGYILKSQKIATGDIPDWQLTTSKQYSITFKMSTKKTLNVYLNVSDFCIYSVNLEPALMPRIIMTMSSSIM